MKVVLHILAALNLIDAFVTWYGIKNDFIKEANPIMDSIYSAHPAWFLSVKILLSVFLYALILYGEIPRKKWFASVAYTAIAVYLLTFLLHGLWISKLLLN
ncbi:hypothetical protein D3H55_06445 [Bacillus salacetis]|uniref:DUF5658 domain-containing protein n=1 Tax=Bacillus salacetis TaxID=2315464 RepID=A0A3A1R210_9BACI|nr:DUF5658 family protein [Bacillus salacetis]RIW36094.1 hypothetical protein D3H55_06445 [Bacillus salacetis]